MILSFVGAACVAGIILYLVLTSGFMGLITWESSYRSYVHIVAVLGLVCLGLGVLLHRKRGVRWVSFGYSCLAVFLSLAAAGIVFALSLGGPSEPVNLNFYTSKSEPLSQENRLSIAVVADTHWGGSGEDAQTRTKILQNIEAGDFDLLMLGGDIVDLGYMRSHFEAAAADMEKYVPTTPVHFVMGNHDVLVNTESVFRRYFQPDESSPNHVLELAPNVHLVVFNVLWDGFDVTRADLRWLDETLSKYDSADTVIVQTHGFIYSSGNVTSGGGKWYDIPALEREIVPILEKHKVDLMVSGHQHSAELMEKNGVYYMLVQSAGKPPKQKIETETAANQIFFDGYTSGYARLDIDGELLRITYLTADSEIMYVKEINTK